MIVNARRDQFSYPKDVWRCDQRTAGILTSWVITASLSLLVVDVVLLCAEEQVVRPHALSIVATVANAHSIGYRSIGDYPGHAVCFDQTIREP